MIKLENIHPLTDFKRNAKAFVDRIKTTQSPIVLTVNGKAEVVIQDATAFQNTQDRLQALEEEIRTLKRQALQYDIQIGNQQLQSGEHSDYDDASLTNLHEAVKLRGRQRLNQHSAP